LLARYRDLADGKLIVKFHDVIVSMPDAQPSTLATYRCSLNVMQSALAALPCRAQYASLGEAFLRPVTVKGGSLLTAALPDHNRRSKVLSVICCLCQLFPGIPDPEREIIHRYWRTCLRESVAAYKAQLRATAGVAASANCRTWQR
jgi:hypothetical protein